MEFDVEIVLRERDFAVTERARVPVPSGRTPREWTDEDVEAVLKAILLALDRVRNPGTHERYVALRGFSWIVEPTADGQVVIAVEIQSGAAVAGPFAADQASLRVRRRDVAPGPHPSSTELQSRAGTYEHGGTTAAHDLLIVGFSKESANV
jgi:hypothetical protein